MGTTRIGKLMAATLALSLAAGCATVPPHPKSIMVDAVPAAGADDAFASEALACAESALSDRGWRIVSNRDDAANLVTMRLSCVEEAGLDEWRVCSSSVDVDLSTLCGDEWVLARKRIEVSGDRGRTPDAARKSLAGKAGRSAAEWIDEKAGRTK